MKHMAHITIPGKLPGINDALAAARKSAGRWSGGNTLKRAAQQRVMACIPSGLKLQGPLQIRYTFAEPNMRRDKDNIAGYAHKVIQDALVEAGVITDDGWRGIFGFADAFCVDRTNPRIEVDLYEVEEEDIKNEEKYYEPECQTARIHA